jgi:hypothetical protein
MWDWPDFLQRYWIDQPSVRGWASLSLPVLHAILVAIGPDGAW